VAAEGGRVGKMANEIARQLRKRMSPQEVKLWVHLRLWKKQGFHFRRQAPRNGYIVDFVCLKYRLIVEVDGGQHNFDSHARRDVRRDKYFTSEGFRVLRFWNNEIDRNLKGVLTVIDHALRNLPPDLASPQPMQSIGVLGAKYGGRRPPMHPPPSGEG
jgi:very-short-patch-repair endonuclease